MAEACGARGSRVERPEDVAGAIEKALAADGPALVAALVDPFEPLMPAKMKPEQAEHYAEALKRGQPSAGRFALTLFRDAVEEFPQNRETLEKAFEEKAPGLPRGVGPAGARQSQEPGESSEAQREGAPERNPEGELWQPGKAPSQALAWAVKSLCKAGTLSVIGVYPPTMRSFPTGEAMNKNLTVRMGNCNHRRYVPALVDLVKSGVVDPEKVLTLRGPMMSALDAYKAFDTRQPGWIKVELLPGASAGKATAPSAT